MKDLHTGRCLCGDIQYTVRGLPLPRGAVVCHCKFCQRQTGAAFAIEVFFAEENVEFTGAKATIYEHRSDESGRWLRLEFCPRCGTRVGMTAERRPGQHAISGGTFDDPDWFAIDRHIWTKSRLRWMEIPAGVERS
jgi:hypothetical protein